MFEPRDRGFKPGFNFVGSDSDEPDTEPLNEVLANLIASPALNTIVDATVDFDGNSKFRTVEVDDERTYWMLAAKL